MAFTGQFDHGIDDKNRLAIPSEIRNAINPETDGASLFLIALPNLRYVTLMPKALFEKLSGKNTAGLAMSPAQAKARRQVFAGTREVVPDKQGRIIIPDHLMAGSETPDVFFTEGLNKDVTLVGANDRIEIWNRSELRGSLAEGAKDPEVQSAMLEMFGAG